MSITVDVERIAYLRTQVHMLCKLMHQADICRMPHFAITTLVTDDGWLPQFLLLLDFVLALAACA